MARRQDRVHRPLRKSEYRIEFGTKGAEKGWRDLCATQRNGVVSAWETLTEAPLESTPVNYRLRDDLATVVRDGANHDQWQHKLAGGARIWFFVEGQSVVLTRVSTAHPNETK